MIYIDYTKTQLAEALRATVIGEVSGSITCLTTDSRKTGAHEGVLFVCLRGERHDGHDFVGELNRSGVRNFVVEKGLLSRSDFPNTTFFEVENTTRALQNLAGHHRLRFQGMQRIGITGSNGKTIVKEWLSRAISEDLRTVRSPGSYNSQVGVPLALLHIGPNDQIGLFEAGISRTGEMERLNEIIAPDIVVLTNLGMAHLENFTNQQSLANEKARLTLGAKKVIYRNDYPEWEQALGDFKGERISWSTNNTEVSYHYEIASAGMQEMAAKLHKGGQVYHFNLPVSDPGSLENALTVITTLLELGFSPDRIAERVERFTPPAWRMELIESVNGCLLLSDVWNADLTSLSSTLDFANTHRHGRHLTLVLTDLLQSGIPPAELYARAARLLRDKDVFRLIGIGPEISGQDGAFDVQGTFYPSVEAAMADAELSFMNEMIVFKGARSFKLERMVEAFSQKSHQTALIIDLDTLEQNLNALKSEAGPETGIVAVVKASAYGSGSAEVASVLEFNRVDYLAVAYADEGVRLREAGISTPIMVLNMVFGTNELLIRHRLEPEIFSFSGLHSFILSLKKANLKVPYPIHIKLDTGMHRLGFLPEEQTELLRVLIENRDFVRPATVFSHLAAADNPAHDEFTRHQISLFVQEAEEIEAMLGHRVKKHIANTSGLLRFPESRLDLVRTGIGLYGVGDDKLLRPVHRFVSVISQIKNIKKGETVSYDRTFEALNDMVIGIVAAGYADGFPRALSNGLAKVWVKGKSAPVVGRICMDMTIIDLTGVQAKEGDEVELFGNHISLQQLAASCNRIPYEILSGIAPRVKRVYVRES